MNKFTIRRGNYEVEISSLGALRPVEVGEDVGAIFARGLLHYSPAISKLVVEKQGSGKDAKLVDLPWSVEGQKGMEDALLAILGVVFSDVKLSGAKRVKTTKVDVGAAVASALRAAGLGEEAVKTAMLAGGHAYVAPQATPAPVSDEKPGDEMA